MSSRPLPYSPEQIAAFLRQYREADLDRDGRVSVSELEILVRTLGLSIDRDELADLVADADDNLNDELDFEVGRVAVKKGGGHGGHNGLRDIIQKLGSRDFLRVRVGIGRPKPPFRGDVADWVLTDFFGDDLIALPDMITRAKEAIDLVMKDGVRAAMNQFNTPSGSKKKKADKATDSSPNP